MPESSSEIREDVKFLVSQFGNEDHNQALRGLLLINLRLNLAILERLEKMQGVEDGE